MMAASQKLRNRIKKKLLVKHGQCDSLINIFF